MINLKKLTQKDLGRKVIYRSKGGDKVEEGLITGWNEKFIFVNYSKTYHGIATRPEDLEFIWDRKDKKSQA